MSYSNKKRACRRSFALLLAMGGLVSLSPKSFAKEETKVETSTKSEKEVLVSKIKALREEGKLDGDLLKKYQDLSKNKDILDKYSFFLKDLDFIVGRKETSKEALTAYKNVLDAYIKYFKAENTRIVKESELKKESDKLSEKSEKSKKDLDLKEKEKNDLVEKDENLKKALDEKKLEELNKGFESREEALKFAKEYIKSSDINKSFNISMGADNKYYVSLSIKDDSEKDKDDKEDSKIIVDWAEIEDIAKPNKELGEPSDKDEPSDGEKPEEKPDEKPNPEKPSDETNPDDEKEKPSTPSDKDEKPSEDIKPSDDKHESNEDEKPSTEIKKPVDKKALKAAIAKLDKIELKDLTKEGKNLVLSLKTKAFNLDNKADASQEEINSLVKEINKLDLSKYKSEANLKAVDDKKADKKDLEKMINELNGLDKSKLSDEQKNKVESLQSKAIEIFNKDDASQEEIDEVLKQYDDLKKELHLKVDDKGNLVEESVSRDGKGALPQTGQNIILALLGIGSLALGSFAIFKSKKKKA